MSVLCMIFFSIFSLGYLTATFIVAHDLSSIFKICYSIVFFVGAAMTIYFDISN